jgi:hypothetical protein
MAERRYMNVEIADRLDKLPRKPDFLLSLAQRGGRWARIAGIDLAARKRNLAAMVGETCCALGKQDARLVALDHRHQHRRRLARPHRRKGGEHGRISAAGEMAFGLLSASGTLNVSLFCAREKNSDAVTRRLSCSAPSVIGIHAAIN